MDDKELIDYLHSLIGVPYNRNEDVSTHSLEKGFNCFSWCAFVYSLADKGDYKLSSVFSDLKQLHKYFKRVNPPYKFLDIALWNNLADGKRHIGVMENNQWAIQCSSGTNGVGRVDIKRPIWANTLEGVYRHEV